MNTIRTKLRKIKYAFRHDFFSIENVVLIVAIFLCFIWTIQAISAMSRNWELSERLSSEKKQLELLSLELEAAELENTYYQTTEYQELIARRDLDKQNAGEHMVVMPENSDAAKNKHKINLSTNTEKQYSNIEKWFKFLFPTY